MHSFARVIYTGRVDTEQVCGFTQTLTDQAWGRIIIKIYSELMTIIKDVFTVYCYYYYYTGLKYFLLAFICGSIGEYRSQKEITAIHPSILLIIIITTIFNIFNF